MHEIYYRMHKDIELALGHTSTIEKMWGKPVYRTVPALSQ